MRESAAQTLNLDDPAATEAFAARLAEALPPDISGWLILLSGELGSGKSTLARALLRSLGHSGTVPSPTYTLVEPYEVSGKLIYHVDLYRVSDAEELTFLGWDELREGMVLVEWPERAAGLLDDADLHIELCYAGTGRSMRLAPLSDRGAALLARLIS